MRSSPTALALAIVSFFISFSALADAQNAASPEAPPQTARQALIEMFFGRAPGHLEKHLPEVTRQAFQELHGDDGQSLLTTFSMLAMQAENEKEKVETFDTGSILFSARDLPGSSYDKIDITVEQDDLSGDEDRIELALHMSRAGKEETLPFIPRFTFVMKMESDVWRLNEISLGVRLPLADPAFLKALAERQRGQNEQSALISVRSVVFAEQSYQSAQGGFACTLSSLGNTGKNSAPGHHSYLFDSQLASGKKNGYNFAISGCDTTHYQLVAEPAVPESGQRAFCSDETGTVRASSDGKAATCLNSGEVVEDKTAAASVRLNGPPPQNSPLAGNSQSVQRVRVSQGVSAGLLITKVNPVYPPEARTARIQGTVVLRAIINPAGDVETLTLISGHPLLVPAAMDAVKQWKYKPYLLNGKAVTVDTQITVNFALTGG